MIEPNELASFDPIIAFTSGTVAAGKAGFAVYDVLVQQETNTFSIIPGTAETLTSSDAVTWTMKLRPNIRFSDGSAYDANAVKQNWQRHADPALASQASATVASIQSLDVVDPLTLRMTLKAPNGQWPRAVARKLGFIAAPSSIAKGNLATNPIGAGPFILKEWVRDDHMTFVRNPNYWNAPLPYLDQLTLKPITDDTQAYNSFTTGEASVMQSANFVNADKANKAGYGMNVVTPSAGRSIIFNTTKPLVSDVRLRKAVALALDYNLLNTQVNNGLAPVAKYFFDTNSPFYDTSIPLNATDKAQAQQLFNAVAADNGGQVKFTISDTTSNSQLDQAIQGQLNAYDKVNVTIDAQSVNTFIGSVLSGNYTVGVWNLIGFDPEPAIYSNFRSGSGQNYSRYSNPDMDKALDTGHTALDVPTRAAAYKTMQQLIVRDVPEIYLWRAPNYNIYKSNVQNVITFEDGIIHYDQVWLQK